MPYIAPAFVTVNPSFIEPGLIIDYSQASGAFDTIADGEPLVRLGEGDLLVYAKRIQMRNKMAAGQSAYNMLPSLTIAMSQLSTPTYLARIRAEWDHHDAAAMGKWGVPIQEASRLGAFQGHFQLARTALLYGFNPQNGEGLINAQGATSLNLPADPNGNTTVVTYDNGAMAQFLIQQIGALKTRTNQLGIGKEFAILGPQRTLAAFEYNIVQLVQYQRPGAGSDSTAGTVKEVLLRNGDKITWSYDDTLIGKGSGGADAVIITMPKVSIPMQRRINTNVFSEVAPALDVCTTMYSDLAAPREIPSPLPGGAVDMLWEWRITSGWGVRPEAITIISMIYQ